MDQVEKRIELFVKKANQILNKKSDHKFVDEISDDLNLHNLLDVKTCQLIVAKMLRSIQESETDEVYDSICSIVVTLKFKLLSCQSCPSNATNWQEDDEEFESIVMNNRTTIDVERESTDLGEDWENLRQQLKCNLIASLVDAKMKSIHEKEKYFQRMRLLMKLEESDNFNGIDLFDSIRHQRMNKLIDASQEITTICTRIKFWIKIDLELVNDYHLLYGKISYQQIAVFYLNFIKHVVKKQTKVYYHENVEPEKLIQILSSLNQLNHFLAKNSASFSPTINELSPQFSDVWNWQNYFLSIGIDNLLLRYLNQGLLQIMSNELIAGKDDDNEKILPQFDDIFKFLKSFDDINLPDFRSSFKVIVNVSVIDYIIKTVNQKVETSNLKTKYILLNSVIMALNQLIDWRLSTTRIESVYHQLRSSIKSDHLTRLMYSSTDLEHSIIYLIKLSSVLRNDLPNEKENESHIFVSILKDFLGLMIKIDLAEKDVLILCHSVINLIMPFAENKDQLMSNEFKEIHSSCLIMLLKLVINNNDDNHEAKRVDQEIDDQTINYATCLANILNHLPSNLWINFKIISNKVQKPKVSSIIRPFLESKCIFSETFFSTINVMPENETQLIDLLKMVLKIALLDESEENSINFLLTAIIKSKNDWIWLCGSTFFSSHPCPWWLSSLQSIFDQFVNPFMEKIVPPFVYRFCLNLDEFEELFEKAESLDKLSELSRFKICEECTKSILSCITSIVQTLPLCLVKNMNNLCKSSPRKINVLFSSLTGQLVFKSILNHIKQASLSSEINNNSDYTLFYNNIHQCLTKIIHNQAICDFIASDLNCISQLKKELKEDCIIAGELDRFELVDRIVKDDVAYGKIADKLFNFIVANRETFSRINTGNSFFQGINLTFKKTNQQPTYDIVKEFDMLNEIPLELTTNQREQLWQLRRTLFVDH